MTRKQVAFIIAVNAVISAAISVAVALLLVRPGPGPATTILPGGVTATQSISEQVMPTSTSELVVHVVAAGDTISGLALRYDISDADIIAANNLENPNFLQVGMQLIIPVGGVTLATATFTPAPTPSDTPIPFEPPSAGMTATAAAKLGATATPLPTPLPGTGERQIAISEILAQGDITQERVTIVNNGDQLADMQDWTLNDSDGNTFEFPNFRLWGAGSMIVHSRIGQDSSPPANFYWGKLEAVWSLGEKATLKDKDGQVVSTLVVGP